MTQKQARQILFLHQPGTADEHNPEVVEALELARRDAGLAMWLEQHQSNHHHLQSAFRSLPVPSELLDQILRNLPTTKREDWWHRPWLAAAALVFLLGTLLLVLRTTREEPDFAQFRSRMIGNTLRQYGMDLVTNRHEALREFVAAQGAPSDYVLPPRLSNLPLTGGGVLRWQNHPVTMVCLDRGTNGMVFLYVIQSTAMDDPPPAAPLQREDLRNVETYSWTRQGHTYLLMGSPDQSVPEDLINSP